MKRTRARMRGATAPQQTGGRVLNALFRLYISGGGLVLTVILFLATKSLWALTAMIPWFLVARLMKRLG
jgi:type IV secretory pathway VirB3-like protein